MESKKINQLATELSPELSDLTIIGDPNTGISKKITLSQMASLFTGTVEEYANLASFPLVGAADTIYIALDTNIIYRWNTGTSAYVELSPNIVTSLVFNDANGFDGTINLVGSTATLTITTALTTGSVGFIGASGALLQDNANFFWDDTNNRLGIGTNAPTTALDVFGSGIIGRVNGTSTNNAFLAFASAGSNKWSIGNVQSDHRFRIYSEANTSELVSVLQTGQFGIGIANPTTKFHLFGGASALIANLDANTSVAKSVSFRSDNSARFNIEVSGTESGSNTGANFFIRRYSDAGSLIDTPLTISRSTGAATFISSISATGATLTSTQTNLVLNTTTNTSFSKLSFQDNGVEKGTLTYANSAFAATSRRNKLEIANAGGINFITQNAPLTPDMVINSSGNVSIGNTNDTFKLDVNGTGNYNGVLKVSDSTGFSIGTIAGYRRIEYSGTTFAFLTDTNAYANIIATGLSLSSNASTAANITSVGSTNYASVGFFNTTTGYGYDIGFGGSSTIAPNSFYIYGGSTATVKFSISSTGFATFDGAGSGWTIGNGPNLIRIDYTSGTFRCINASNGFTPIAASAFNVNSDYRLKEDLKPFNNSLEILNKIKIYDFKWKANKERNYGVIAHELQEVLPYIVYGEKDGMEENGDIRTQGVDYGKIVPILIKGIQELEARIKQLESK